MKKITPRIILSLMLCIACKTSNSSSDTKELKLQFEAKSNSTVSGSATLVEKNGKVTFTAKIAGLKPGMHAIHIHEKSDCSAPDGSSTGGHWNPTFKKHGKWGVGEYHKGYIGKSCS